MTSLKVTYHAGYQGTRQTMNVAAEADTDHDTLARIIAVARTGNPDHRHVLTIDEVEVLTTPYSTETGADRYTPEFEASLRCNAARLETGNGDLIMVPDSNIAELAREFYSHAGHAVTPIREVGTDLFGFDVYDLGVTAPEPKPDLAQTVLLDTLTMIVKHADTVNTHAFDYYQMGTTVIDLDVIRGLRIEVIRRDLTELDEIVNGSWESYLLTDGFLPVPEHVRLLVQIIERARTLAAAIRAAISVVVEL